MPTITALELRQNLKEVLERVQAGEEIVVTYRGGTAVRLVPERRERPAAAGLDALLALESAGDGNKHPEEFRDSYAQHLDEKYGKYTR